MAEIDFLLLDQTQEKMPLRKAGSLQQKASMVRLEERWWHGFFICLHRVPACWLAEAVNDLQDGESSTFGNTSAGTLRLWEYVEKQRKNGVQLWIDRELERLFPDYVQPIPDWPLALFLVRNLPSRPIMILNLEEGAWDLQWQQRFLESVCMELRELWMIGRMHKNQQQFTERTLFDRIYEESGLVITAAEKIPKTDGRFTILVDISRKSRADCMQLPGGCLYLDLTSEKEKQRRLSIKRTDISYMSARNFLDTALKARYNAS